VVHPVWSISARTGHEGGVRVGTVVGVSVGSGVDQVAGWDDPDRLGTLALDDHTTAELLVDAAPGYPLVPDRARGAYGVLAVADVYPGPITTLTAPSQHGGA
jgi:pimeloyl-ACP methyl ester carboxylesterase